MTIRTAKKEDIDSWMKLVIVEKENFPGLETVEALDEHRKIALDLMEQSSAICAEEKGVLCGALLFSREENELCFLLVASAFRRRHIAEQLLQSAFSLMDSKRNITVTTYRSEDKRGTAARALYQNMGFCPDVLLEEFGAPVQRFVRKAGK